MSTVGFLGLGRMGAGMSARLIGPEMRSVDRLLVHDISDDAVGALVAKGAEAAGSAKALGEQCDIVFTSLPQPAIVRSAILGPDGIAAGGKVKIVCDLSTSGPRLAQELSAGLAPHGIASFDAPVSGGIKGANEGTLSLMVAGPEAQYETVRPLLERMGKPFYMGETPGAGQTMKLVNNLLGAVAIAVTSEGMAMGINGPARSCRGPSISALPPRSASRTPSC